MAKRKLKQLIATALMTVALVATSSRLPYLYDTTVVGEEVEPYEEGGQSIKQHEEEVKLEKDLIRERNRQHEVELEKARQEAERIRLEAEEKAKRDSKRVVFELTFYTSLPSENGGYSNMANGKPVTSATNAIASNVYKLGTVIHLENMGTYTVQDRGGKSFNKSNRLDVLVPRKAGETDSQYKQRVLNMGRKTVVGYIMD